MTFGKFELMTLDGLGGLENHVVAIPAPVYIAPLAPTPVPQPETEAESDIEEVQV